MALSLMCSDNSMRNVFELFCTAFWIIGIYALIILSNMIEEEIKTLEGYRKTERNTDLDLNTIQSNL